MAQKIVKTRLVHRKDLSTKWSSVNPILLDGEMGIEKDKIGREEFEGLFPADASVCLEKLN